ncbi:LysM domain-containing protein [Klenkia terrae]|uniref:LysM peptidoglycan-binding domain-containing protein n=1 Tax=Klenkia terrae TaxID=1052259 RepID=UPI001773ED82|nr:LysM peptidoglycan-binding domain-containing protein [Klenkia terrae]SSC25057.1 LysM domain-containing protein [Klenkia terrae]
MASTAAPPRPLPTARPARAAESTADAGARPAPTRVVARRGNHPAGRALARAAEQGTGPLAPVVPLRRTGAVVVPLRPAAPPVLPAASAAEPVGSAASPGTTAPAPLRLTRRGRLVLCGLGVVTALGLAAFAVPALGGGDPAVPALELAGRSSVVVYSGDTLWSIAEAVAPDTDPRVVVDAIQEANGLSGAGLVPGQVLVLP